MRPRVDAGQTGKDPSAPPPPRPAPARTQRQHLLVTPGTCWGFFPIHGHQRAARWPSLHAGPRWPRPRCLGRGVAVHTRPRPAACRPGVTRRVPPSSVCQVAPRSSRAHARLPLPLNHSGVAPRNPLTRRPPAGSRHAPCVGESGRCCRRCFPVLPCDATRAWLWFLTKGVDRKELDFKSLFCIWRLTNVMLMTYVHQEMARQGPVTASVVNCG